MTVTESVLDRLADSKNINGFFFLKYGNGTCKFAQHLIDNKHSI